MAAIWQQNVHMEILI